MGSAEGLVNLVTVRHRVAFQDDSGFLELHCRPSGHVQRCHRVKHIRFWILSRNSSSLLSRSPDHLILLCNTYDLKVTATHIFSFFGLFAGYYSPSVGARPPVSPSQGAQLRFPFLVCCAGFVWHMGPVGLRFLFAINGRWKAIHLIGLTICSCPVHSTAWKSFQVN